MKFLIEKSNIKVEKLSDGLNKLIIQEIDNLLGASTNQIEVTLSDDEIKALGLNIILIHPVIEPKIDLGNELDAVRYLARGLVELSDRDMQCLLREVQSDALIETLWLMESVDLSKLVFRNMSQRAAQMLLEDLESKSVVGSVNLEKNVKKAISAKKCVLEILSIAKKLVNSGQIENFSGGADE